MITCTQLKKLMQIYVWQTIGSALCNYVKFVKFGLTPVLWIVKLCCHSSVVKVNLFVIRQANITLMGYLVIVYYICSPVSFRYMGAIMVDQNKEITIPKNGGTIRIVLNGATSHIPDRRKTDLPSTTNSGGLEM